MKGNNFFFKNWEKVYFSFSQIKWITRKLPELKAEAKRLGLNNYSRLRKQELIDLLRNQTEPMDNRKLPELKAEAKRLGLNDYSGLKKQELINLLRNQTVPKPSRA